MAHPVQGLGKLVASSHSFLIHVYVMLESVQIEQYFIIYGNQYNNNAGWAIQLIISQYRDAI